MNRALVVSTFGGLVLAMWLAAWSVVGSAERSPELPTGDQVDTYYEAHPDQVKRPVVDAIFQAVK